MTNKTLHLMTQRGQSYGSERRCCERCGLMLVARPDSFWQEHAWTDEEREYHDNNAGHTTCDTVRHGKPTMKPKDDVIDVEARVVKPQLQLVVDNTKVSA